MTQWKWKPSRSLGIWRYGAEWARPLLASAPYLTIGLLLLMFYFVSETLTIAEGVFFDLPIKDGNAKTGLEIKAADVGLVVLIVPQGHGTVIFFDDMRYQFEDIAALNNFTVDLSRRLAHASPKTVLVLSDWRISTGKLVQFMSAVQGAGAERVYFASRSEEKLQR